MQTQIKSKSIVERRREAPEHSIWWDKLSLAQKFSASSLAQFGYELSFIRADPNTNERLAVLQSSSSIAVISEEGDINTSPDIKIRL